MLHDNVVLGSRVITDDNSAYKPNKITRLGMIHDKVNHSAKEYVRGDVYTNTIEGFFSQLKRSIDGTYHRVSLKHLNSYVEEFAYHYNSRKFSCSVFHDLLGRVVGKPYQEAEKIGLFAGVRVS
jgi:hypothetical protein